MEVPTLDSRLSNLSFITADSAYVQIFSSLSVADVTRLWKDLVLLKSESDVKTVHIFINSGGGDAFSGLALADEIERAKKDFNVVCHASGIIASAAVPVFAVCDERIASPGTLFMVHESAMWKWPGRETASDIRAQNEMMDLLRERYIGILTERSNISKERWCEMESKTTYFTTEQAKEWGLVDKIE